MIQNQKNQHGQDLAFDEVSIIELLLIVRRQWKTVVTVSVLCLLLAVGYVNMREDLYKYTVDVEIGQLPQKPMPNDLRFIVVPPEAVPPPRIDSPENVAAQLESAWIPEAFRHARDKFIDSENRTIDWPAVRASVRDNGEVVRITSIASTEYESIVDIVMRKAAARVVAEHAAHLETLLKSKQRKLKQLRVRHNALSGRIDSMDQRTENLRRSIQQSEKQDLAAAIELNVVIPERAKLSERSDELENLLEDTKGEVEILLNAVDIFQARIIDEKTVGQQTRIAAALERELDFRPTRCLNLPTTSIESVAVEGKIWILLSLAFGLVAGVVLALTLEGIYRSRIET